MNPALAAIARRQMALFTLEQALASGYSARQVQRRRETGCWDQVHAGVYRVAGAPESWEQRVLAACLAAGPVAVASHRSAARLWGLEESRATVELSVPPSRTHRLHGVIVHRTSDLGPAHIARREGIPVTTPVRTLVDLGAVQTARLVERVLDIALSRRMVTLEGLRATLESVARRGPPGRRRPPVAARRARRQCRADGIRPRGPHAAALSPSRPSGARLPA